MFSPYRPEKKSKRDFFARSGGIVHRLHHLGGDDGLIDMRRKLFAGLDAADERVDLLLEHCLRFELGLKLAKRAAAGAVNRKIAAVNQSGAGLGANEVDVRLADADVLRPRTVEGDRRPFGADKAGHEIVDVVGAVEVLGILGPHALIHIVGHIDAELGKRLGRNGLGLRVAGAVHHDIEIVNAPVDQHAAAADGIGRERAAQPRDRALRAEGHVNVIDFAEVAALNELAQLIDGGIEAVDHADVEHLAGLMLRLLHLERVRIGAGRRLLAEDVLAAAQAVDRDDRVHLVRGADRNRLDLGVGDDVVIVLNRDAAAILLHGGLRLLGQDVAEILDFHVGVGHIGRDMRAVGDGTAAYDADFDLSHCQLPPKFSFPLSESV